MRIFSWLRGAGAKTPESSLPASNQVQPTTTPESSSPASNQAQPTTTPESLSPAEERRGRVLVQEGLDESAQARETKSAIARGAIKLGFIRINELRSRIVIEENRSTPSLYAVSEDERIGGVIQDPTLLGLKQELRRQKWKILQGFRNLSEARDYNEILEDVCFVGGFDLKDLEWNKQLIDKLLILSPLSYPYDGGNTVIVRIISSYMRDPHSIPLVERYLSKLTIAEVKEVFYRSGRLRSEQQIQLLLKLLDNSDQKQFYNDLLGILVPQAYTNDNSELLTSLLPRLSSDQIINTLITRFLQGDWVDRPSSRLMLEELVKHQEEDKGVFYELLRRVYCDNRTINWRDRFKECAARAWADRSRANETGINETLSITLRNLNPMPQDQRKNYQQFFIWYYHLTQSNVDLQQWVKGPSFLQRNKFLTEIYNGVIKLNQERKGGLPIPSSGAGSSENLPIAAGPTDE